MGNTCEREEVQDKVFDPTALEGEEDVRHNNSQFHIGGLLSTKYVEAPAPQPVYVGSVTDLQYQGILYFDTGSTGTRPYVFIHKSTDNTLAEFWAMTRGKEMQTIKLHTCLHNAMPNEEFLKKLKDAASDEEKIGILSTLEVSEEFVDYVVKTLTQAAKIVNKWMVKEEEAGVTFWSNGSAVLISDVILAITGGLRTYVGESPAVVQELNARLTGHLVTKLRMAYVLNGVRMSARLLVGAEEAKCEAAAVRVLAKMVGGDSDATYDVISMGGASIQINAGGKNMSVPLARNAAIEAAKSWISGQKEALTTFETQFSTALKQTLRDTFCPDLLVAPRHWVAVSGMFYVARDLGLILETPTEIAEVLLLVRSKIESLQKAGDPSKLGSATCAAVFLSHLSGHIIFQREWVNPRTKQKLAATVSTGHVVRHLGYDQHH